MQKEKSCEGLEDSKIVWITGFSRSGKTTLAKLLQKISGATGESHSSRW